LNAVDEVSPWHLLSTKLMFGAYYHQYILDLRIVKKEGFF